MVVTSGHGGRGAPAVVGERLACHHQAGSLTAEWAAFSCNQPVPRMQPYVMLRDPSLRSIASKHSELHDPRPACRGAVGCRGTGPVDGRASSLSSLNWPTAMQVSGAGASPRKHLANQTAGDFPARAGEAKMGGNELPIAIGKLSIVPGWVPISVGDRHRRDGGQR